MEYDEAKLKPFLIRKYDRLRALVEDKYQDQIKLNFETEEVGDIANKIEELKATQAGLGRHTSFNYLNPTQNPLSLFDSAATKKNRTRSTFGMLGGMSSTAKVVKNDLTGEAKGKAKRSASAM